MDQLSRRRCLRLLETLIPPTLSTISKFLRCAASNCGMWDGCRSSAHQAEEVSGHLAPCQLNAVCRFHGKSFPWGKAATSLGRGALRLSGGCFELTTPHRDGLTDRTAPHPPPHSPP